MTKLTYKETQFLKLISDNIRFMEKLERNSSRSKRPGQMIYVSMNKLSDQEQVKAIKNPDELLRLPESLIMNEMFRFKLLFKSLEHSDKRVVEFLYCPLNQEEIKRAVKDKVELTSVKIEYRMSYDAAGEENQRKWDKQNKKE